MGFPYKWRRKCIVFDVQIKILIVFKSLLQKFPHLHVLNGDASRQPFALLIRGESVNNGHAGYTRNESGVIVIDMFEFGPTRWAGRKFAVVFVPIRYQPGR